MVRFMTEGLALRHFFRSFHREAFSVALPLVLLTCVFGESFQRIAL